VCSAGAMNQPRSSKRACQSPSQQPTFQPIGLRAEICERLGEFLLAPGVLWRNAGIRICAKSDASRSEKFSYCAVTRLDAVLAKGESVRCSAGMKGRAQTLRSSTGQTQKQYLHRRVRSRRATVSQMSDGAGAVLLCSESALKRYNLTPIGKFLGFSVAGVPPEIMGIGPKEANTAGVEASGLELERYGLDRTQRGLRSAVSGSYWRCWELDPALVNSAGWSNALAIHWARQVAIPTATLMHGCVAVNRNTVCDRCVSGRGWGQAGVFEAFKRERKWKRISVMVCGLLLRLDVGAWRLPGEAGRYGQW